MWRGEGAQVRSALPERNPAGILSRDRLFWHPHCAEQWAADLAAGDGRWCRLLCTSTSQQTLWGRLPEEGRAALGNGTCRFCFQVWLQLHKRMYRNHQSSPETQHINKSKKGVKKQNRSTAYGLVNDHALLLVNKWNIFLLLQWKSLS